MVPQKVVWISWHVTIDQVDQEVTLQLSYHCHLQSEQANEFSDACHAYYFAHIVPVH